jgi:CheY-like chemotaxis protein
MRPDILIIEDNAQNMYLLTFLLEKNGYSVIQAENGILGLAAAEKYKPSVIMLDIQLPGMSGYEVARMLKKNVKLENIPLIAVTSYAMPGDREKAMASGCIGYIEKPIDPETFIHDFQSCLPDNLTGES